MTYKEIIDQIKAVADAHTMVQTVGYGQISDISFPDDQKSPDYPYFFINPVSASANERTISVNLNLIAMTQHVDREGLIIQAQSEMMQILNDILAEFNYGSLKTGSIVVASEQTFTPFVERFQDDVSGATANVTFTAKAPMSACDTPISL